MIVEDILESGKTLHYLVNLLKSREPNSIEICTLFDKPERREVDVHAKYIGLSLIHISRRSARRVTEKPRTKGGAGVS